MLQTLPAPKKRRFVSLVVFFAFFMVSFTASAGIFEIGYRKESNGTVTFFFQSNRFKIDCPNTYITINVNGTNYTIPNSSIQGGDYRNTGNTSVLAQANDCLGNELSDPESYCSWGSINLPCLPNMVISIVDAGPCYTSCLLQSSYSLSCDNLTLNIKAKNDALCYGDEGGITLQIQGGVAPYQYKLDGGDFIPVSSLSFTVEDITVGDHTIAVKDAAGNNQSVSFTINSPLNPLDATSSGITNVKCNAASTGSVVIAATGGTPPYTVEGKIGSFTSTFSISGLAGGNYEFVVKDANGCLDPVNVEIKEPEKITLNAVQVPACGGPTGSVTITATGGTPPYTGAGIKSNLAPGTYTFVVTDANQCSASITVTVDGSGTGTFNPLSEVFPNQFNTSFTRSLYNRTFNGSSGVWTVNSNENATMVVTTPYYSPSAPHALKVVNFKTYNCGSGWAKAVSPKINLSGPCCPAEVKFNFTLWTYNVVCNDTKAKLEIDFSADGGASWTEVWARTSGQLWSSYGANGKVNINIPVPIVYQNANFRYRIRGEMEAGNYNNFYVFIDDIHITSPAVCTPLGSIGNFVWHDQNSNGVQDASEPGIANATVKLTLPNGTSVTKLTDAAGAYNFSGLQAGNYVVTFTTPSGYVPTASNAGTNDGLDSDPVSGVVNVSLGVGQHNNTIDAGYRIPVCTNTVSHKETFPYKFNSYFTTSLYNKTFTGSSGTWTVNSNSRGTMVVTAPYYSPSTSYALKVVNYNTNGCGAGWTKAVSPKIDLSEPCCPSELKMTFTLWTYKVVAGDYKAKLEIDFSKDNGYSWTEVWSKSSAQLHYYHGANGKTYVTIAIPAIYQNANFRYRIRGEMASGDCYNFHVFMDDIKISSPSTCSATYTNARIANGSAEESSKRNSEESQTGIELATTKIPQTDLTELVKPAFDIKVYPNPTQGEFELRLTSTEKANAAMRVVDALGRVVKTMMIPSGQTIRFGSDLRPGNYLVEVMQGKKKEVIKLVKL